MVRPPAIALSIVLATALAWVGPGAILRLSEPAHAAAAFTLTSPAVTSQGPLPAAYTCDGAGTSPPLTWTAARKGTKGYALVMDHVPPEGGYHWYWLMWGIPTKTLALSANVTKIGFLGGNSVNSSIGYAAPCSKGPGTKTYTITVYALSGSPKLPKKSSASVTRDSLLAAISGITVDKAVLDVTYSR